MPLGTVVGLSAGHILLDEGPISPSPRKGHSSPHFSAYVYCGQTAAWIEMPLGTKVCLGLGHIVLDGDLAPPPAKRKTQITQFSAHVYCGQTAVCIRIPIRTEVGLDLCDIVLDGDPAPPPLRCTAPNFRPVSVVAKRLHGSRAAWIKVPLGAEVTSAQATLC